MRCVEVGAWIEVDVVMGELVRHWSIVWVLRGAGVEISGEVWDW